MREITNCNTCVVGGADKPLHPNATNMQGCRVGRLVVELAKRVGNRLYWSCQCDCGNRVTVLASNLHRKTRPTQSCGCLTREVTAARSVIHGYARHDETRPPEYGIWRGIRYRCTNPKNKDWNTYGGRGIKLCDRWGDFSLFYLDMGPRPTDKHTIERINHDGDYCPENCVWASMIVQQRNRRNNHMLTYNNETLSVAEWAERLGINYYTLWARVVRGKLPLEQAMTVPVKQRRKV